MLISTFVALIAGCILNVGVVLGASTLHVLLGSLALVVLGVLRLVDELPGVLLAGRIIGRVVRVPILLLGNAGGDGGSNGNGRETEGGTHGRMK